MKIRSYLIGIGLCMYCISVSAQKTSTTHKQPAPNKAGSSAAQKKNAVSYSKTKSGLEYKIFKDSAGIAPELGGFMTFWFLMRDEKDSILDNQMNEPNPLAMPVPEVTHKPSIEEGFHLLTAGDSAVFVLNADSLFRNTFNQPLPAHIRSGSNIQMFVKVDKVYSKKFVDSMMVAQEALEKQRRAAAGNVDQKDSISIQNYLALHKLKAVITPSGAYVVTLVAAPEKQGYIKAGEAIQTTYRGSLLNGGAEFDKSPAGDFFKFTVGTGQVIVGWDEGFQKLKRGEKALILIPSRLGYGARGAGASIPPNAPLLFEVEVQK